MEFYSSNIIRDVTISDKQSLPKPNSLSKYVLMTLVAVFVVLIGVSVSKKKITKIAGLLTSTARKSPDIPSVSILMILKSIYLNGTDFQKIVEMAIKECGEIFQLNLLGLYNFVFVTNPLMVKKLFVSTKLEHLHKPELYNKLCFGPIKNGLISARAETWKLHRNVINKAFTYKGLIRQLNIFEEHSKKFILTLQKTCNSNPSLSKPMISIDEQVHTLTFEIILHIAAGKQVQDVSQEESKRFHGNFERVKELAAYRIKHFINTIDFVWKLNSMKNEMDGTLDELGNYADKIITSIRKQFDADANDRSKTEDDMDGRSLVELMINAGFSNDVIFTELSTLIVAGHETTSTCVKLMLFLLASHKEYYDKCQKEIDNMFDQMDKLECNDISMEALNSLTFLDMCIKECLRMYPVVMLFGREVNSPIQLDENTYLPQNTLVFTSPWIIHRNPKLYPDPEKFDPERFSAENVRKRGMGEYFPFSLGPRNCIGFKSATIEVKVLIAYVLRNFEVHSEMTIAKLNCLLSKTVWPFPELDIKISARQ